MTRAYAFFAAFTLLAVAGPAAAQQRVELRFAADYDDLVPIEDPDARLGAWLELAGGEAESGRLTTGVLALVLGAGQVGLGAGLYASFEDRDTRGLYLAIGVLGLFEMAFGVALLAIPTGHERRRDRWRARSEPDEAERHRFEGELRVALDVDRTERDLYLAIGIGSLIAGGAGAGLTAWLAEGDDSAIAGYTLSAAVGTLGLALFVRGLLDVHGASMLEHHERGLGPRVSIEPRVGPSEAGVAVLGSFE